MSPSLVIRSCVPEGTLPHGVGLIYFVGIGGIGMSGIAELLKNLGYDVAGSDASDNANVQRLRDKDIVVHIGHHPENIMQAAVVVKSTAVPYTNPEIQAARQRGIPVVRRSEMLAELTRLKATIAVAGSHGKTTTTSMVAHLLATANMDPTVINGGIINAYGTNVHLGQGNWLVAEADESDGTFLNIPATIGIVTNLDPEHLDYWGDFNALKEGFRTFLHKLPFYGFAVMCDDHEEVRRIAREITDRRIITYGISSEDAHVRAGNIRATAKGAMFDLTLHPFLTQQEHSITWKDLTLGTHGRHNVLNALAAITVALELELTETTIRQALHSFSGVKRRFTLCGEVNGVAIIDDYAHHPEEIRATLSAAKDWQQSRGGRIIAVAQPHRYSRLEDLFADFTKCFSNADQVILLPVFAAGEKPREGVSSEALKAALEQKDMPCILVDETMIEQYQGQPARALAQQLAALVQQNDIVVCMGAGNITLMAQQLPALMGEESTAHAAAISG